jgi:signal transduction histidine kinase
VAVLANEIRLDEVVAETPDGVILLGDEAVVYANRAADRMFGHAAGALVGKPEVGLFEEPLPLGALARGEGRTLTAVARRGDGTRVLVDVSVAAHATGDARYFSVILRAPTALESCQVRDRLESEREAFLSMAAHQLRSPIQPILVSLRTIEQALRRGAEIPPDTIPRALRQTVRLGRLVDAILRDVATPEGERIPVSVEAFDLVALVREIVEDFRMASPTRTLGFDAPGAAVPIRSDRDRVHQIMVSLLDNALKYSARDRAVTVEVVPTSAGAEVRVRDEGIGIPEEERSRVFSRFFRARNARTSPGLGIGLYFANELAKRLGGAISLDSLEGRGSTFTLALPRALVEKPPRAPARGEERHARSGG